MTGYNGHRNWNEWNVSLWIANDEGLYRQALDCISSTKTKAQAAQSMFRQLRSSGITKTPDDAPYTVTAIRNAMKGLT